MILKNNDELIAALKGLAEGFQEGMDEQKTTREEREAFLEVLSLLRQVSEAVSRGSSCFATLDVLLMVQGRTGDLVIDFEEQAEQFRLSTGKVRPGVGTPGDLDYASFEEYDKWVEGIVDLARRTIEVTS